MVAYLNDIIDLSNSEFINKLEDGDIVRLKFEKGYDYFAEFKKTKTWYLRYSDESRKLVNWIKDNRFPANPDMWSKAQITLFQLTWG